PSRLERAVRALDDLSRAVEERGGHRLALVVFAARARVACPLTNDYEHFRHALAKAAADPDAGIGPKEEDTPSGTRMGEALRRAVQPHEARFRGPQDILMLSDGDAPAGDAEWFPGAVAARNQGIPVHTVGVGDPETPSRIPAGDGFLRYNG